MPLVICLDPHALLNDPCPTLYPEWGDRLLVFSGPRLSDAQRQRCANAIRTAECEQRPFELWQLLRVPDDTLPGEQPAPVTLQEEAFWGQVLARLLQNSGVQPKHLYWSHLLPSAQTAPLPVGAFRLETCFLNPVPKRHQDLARRYLLPAALCTWLDAPALLEGAHQDARNFRTVRLEAFFDGLQKAVYAWRSELQAETRRLQALRDQLGQQPCQTLFLDAEVNSLVTASLNFEGLPTPLHIPWFQRIQHDDVAIRQWFAEVSTQVETVWAKYREELQAQYDEGGRAIARRQPTKQVGAWVQAHLMKWQAKQPPDTPLTAERLCNALKEALNQPENQPQAPTKAADNIRDRLSQWRKKYEDNLRQAARRRPLKAVVLGSVLALGLICVASLLPGVVGMATPPSSPHPWPWLLKASGTAWLGLLLVAWGGVWWLRRQTQQRHRQAAQALEALFKDFQAQAAAHHAAAVGALRAVAMGRNEALLERAATALRNELAQLEHHLDTLNTHQQLHQDVMPQAAQAPQPPDASRLQLSSRPADNPVYPFTCSTGAEMHIGKEHVTNLTPNTQRALQRLAGVAKVYFKND